MDGQARRCRLLMLFQESPHQKLQNSASTLANLIIVDIVKYVLMLNYVITSNYCLSKCTDMWY